MPLTEAQALLQRVPVRAVPDDPQADRDWLRRLAWDCEEFSPCVGIEEGETPESLLLDITGCGACFGGEPRLAEQLLKRMRERGLQPHIGISDTPGAAWGAVHYRTRSREVVIVPSGEQERALAPLPVNALRLSPETIRSLRGLGIRTVSQLAALPRQSLPSRFGEELLMRLDQARGLRPERIVPERRPEPLREVWETEDAISDAESLDAIVGMLVERITASLAGRQQGIKQLVCELRDVEGKVFPQRIELLNPTVAADHLMTLLRLHWERLSFPSGIQRICVEVVQAESRGVRERSLWGTDGETSRGLDTLVETLSSRLGREAVLHPRLEPEEQPELAFRYVPCLEEGSGIRGQRKNGDPHFEDCLTRPVRLKRTPVTVEVWSTLPEGPPYRLGWGRKEHDVIRAWGPERITTGWWRGGHVRRDYFQVELQDGRRFWLFRDLVTGKWFLHAAFD